jgi:glutathione S-transferase
VKYIPPEEASTLPGIRVALTMGYFGPWGQAVKQMLSYKAIDYVPVGQRVGELNEALVEWTGCRNAPIVVSDDNPPAVRWLDQIILIENQKSTPSLLPDDSFERALTIGIISEIAGEGGFGWSRRVLMFQGMASILTDSGQQPDVATSRMMDAYGVRRQFSDPAERAAAVVKMLSGQLRAQRLKGSPFFVGNAVSAADIYWACFSSMLEPFPEAFCRPPAGYTGDHPAILAAQHPLIMAARDSLLTEHRDMMFTQYLEPCWF